VRHTLQIIKHTVSSCDRECSDPLVTFCRGNPFSHKGQTLGCIKDGGVTHPYLLVLVYILHVLQGSLEGIPTIMSGSLLS
jgi:hypothetical protein